MKHFIALVLLMVPVASMAQEFKSLGVCKEFKPDVLICTRCCSYFDMAPSRGRWSNILPGVPYCKCITPAEARKIEQRELAKEAERRAKPRFPSVKSCSDYIPNTSTCTECCRTFGLGASGQRFTIKYPGVGKCNRTRPPMRSSCSTQSPPPMRREDSSIVVSHQLNFGESLSDNYHDHQRMMTSLLTDPMPGYAPSKSRIGSTHSAILIPRFVASFVVMHLQ